MVFCLSSFFFFLVNQPSLLSVNLRLNPVTRILNLLVLFFLWSTSLVNLLIEFNRERMTVHEILGGAIGVGIVTVTIGSWMVFETSAYTVLTLLSSVLLLFFSILFLWSKSASILNSYEAMAEEASKLLRIHLNKLFQVSHDNAMGRDSELFTKVAVSLFLISFIGSLVDFKHFATPLLLSIDGSLLLIYNKAKELYLRLQIWAHPENEKQS
ncbi:hypothetical protein Bca52824_008471 [Brassica carinata]|uniref:Reticulon domain-containing protein n=1 Tax=Brassica carinata TaxID=52824 RepID=A0A8X7W847_BRACI|nr:hypothetical protein Bca52824_008471 [Brassica carinata]